MRSLKEITGFAKDHHVEGDGLCSVMKDKSSGGKNAQQRQGKAKKPSPGKEKEASKKDAGNKAGDPSPAKKSEKAPSPDPVPPAPLVESSPSPPRETEETEEERTEREAREQEEREQQELVKGIVLQHPAGISYDSL